MQQIEIKEDVTASSKVNNIPRNMHVASLKLSALAKRKGFNVPTLFSWDSTGELENSYNYTKNTFFSFVDIKDSDNFEEGFETYLAPTLNQLKDWLLEDKNILIEVTSDTSIFKDVPRQWYCKVHGMFFILADKILSKEDKTDRIKILTMGLTQVLKDLPDDSFYY